MRTLITTLFAVVAISGPWLCCCVPARLLAASEVQSTPVQSQGCPHCLKETVPQKSEPLPVQPCPCQKYEPLETVLPDSKATLISHLESVPVMMTLDTVVVTLPITLETAAVVAVDTPFLTTAMRLYAHHALLC